MKALKRLVVAFLVGIAPVSAAKAADYPTKPVRLVVGQPPGGPTDIAARVYSDKMRALLGQPMLVENKPGAASQISIQLVAKSEPDGYTTLFGGLGLASLPYLSKSYELDSIRDTTPISMIVSLPTAIAASSAMGVKTLDEFMADIKANPGKRFYGAMGAGDYLIMQAFRIAAGLPFETVRFNGAAPGFQAMFAGDVQFTYTTVGILKPLADQGKLRMLVVAGKTRSKLAPDVPSIFESSNPQIRDLGNNVFQIGWFGLVGPAKLSADIVDKLHRSSIAVTRDAEFVKRMGEIGLEPIGNSPAEFQQRLREDLATWQRVTKQMNVQPE